MFTGIIKAIATIHSRTERSGLVAFNVRVPGKFAEGLERGASVAVDGVCLTATNITQTGADTLINFDVMLESLRRTTLNDLAVHDAVNVERSARDGAEVGGHLISGHIDGVAEIVKIDTPENNKVITFKVPHEWMKYIFSKGYLALNGTSLTIVDADKKAATFSVWFIPETLRATTFDQKKVGSKINFEVERGTQVMVDTVRAFLEERFGDKLPEAAAQLLAGVSR
jgi:riboflavin synthase